jgi:hypothetical protein
MASRSLFRTSRGTQNPQISVGLPRNTQIFEGISNFSKDSPGLWRNPQGHRGLPSGPEGSPGLSSVPHGSQRLSSDLTTLKFSPGYPSFPHGSPGRSRITYDSHGSQGIPRSRQDFPFLPTAPQVSSVLTSRAQQISHRLPRAPQEFTEYPKASRFPGD